MARAPSYGRHVFAYISRLSTLCLLAPVFRLVTPGFNFEKVREDLVMEDFANIPMHQSSSSLPGVVPSINHCELCSHIGEMTCGNCESIFCPPCWQKWHSTGAKLAHRPLRHGLFHSPLNKRLSKASTVKSGRVLPPFQKSPTFPIVGPFVTSPTPSRKGSQGHRMSMEHFLVDSHFLFADYISRCTRKIALDLLHITWKPWAVVLGVAHCAVVEGC